MGLATQSVGYRQMWPGSLFEVQNLERHPRLTDSESAFLQDTWPVLMHIKFEKHWPKSKF